MRLLQRIVDSYRAGKTPPLLFYAAGVCRLLVPRALLNARRRRLLKDWEKRPDADEIRRRVELYAPLSDTPLPPERTVRAADISLRDTHSRYWFDLMHLLRHFPADARLALVTGDTHTNPDVPSLIKARRLAPGAELCTIINMDRIRHWLHPRDRIPFDRKIPKLFFRGDCRDKPTRQAFLKSCASSPLVDAGDTSPVATEHRKAPVPLAHNFNYRYILAPEGYDVCSSLQWIMASGCVPVMPRPTAESWLMHSQLQAGVHYIEVQPDYSDVEEKIAWYNARPAEARAIAEASARWVQRFASKRRELIVGLLVVDRYLHHYGCDESGA